MLRRWRLRITSLLRIVFGCLWVCWAWATLQRTFSQGAAEAFLHTRGAAATDTPWEAFWHHLIAAHPQSFACALALYVGVVACGLLTGALTQLVCLLGILLLIFCWSLPTLQLFPGEMSSGDTGVLLFGLFIFIALMIARSFQHAQLSQYPQSLQHAQSRSTHEKRRATSAHLAEKAHPGLSTGSNNHTRRELVKR